MLGKGPRRNPVRCRLTGGNWSDDNRVHLFHSVLLFQRGEKVSRGFWPVPVNTKQICRERTNQRVCLLITRGMETGYPNQGRCCVFRNNKTRDEIDPGSYFILKNVTRQLLIIHKPEETKAGFSYCLYPVVLSLSRY